MDDKSGDNDRMGCGEASAAEVMQYKCRSGDLSVTRPNEPC